MMTRVCSWCKEVLGQKPGRDGITDGICPTCSERLLRELAQTRAALSASLINTQS